MFDNFVYADFVCVDERDLDIYSTPVIQSSQCKHANVYCWYIFFMLSFSCDKNKIVCIWTVKLKCRYIYLHVQIQTLTASHDQWEVETKLWKDI